MISGSPNVQRRIVQLLRDGQIITRQEIGAKLSLSMPTVLQNVTQLMENGILEERGTARSNGGRKAKMLRLRPEAGLVTGINIGVHQIEFVTADLLGNLRQAGSADLVFRDEPDWYVRFQGALLEFLERCHTAPGQILGAGISFPGIIDRQGEQVVRSHILGLSHLGLDRFRKAFSIPAIFANDANCACFAERRSGRQSYVYLSLNESVGGAIMTDGQIWNGDSIQAGEVGHMILVPGGRPCYCGKQGCADAYLSPQALERDGWEAYLDHLAILVTNLRMLLDVNLVIGGQVGTQIGPYMEKLQTRAARYDLFARDVDYVFPCVQREHACALGAAGFALEAFGARVLQESEEERV